MHVFFMQFMRISAWTKNPHRLTNWSMLKESSKKALSHFI